MAVLNRHALRRVFLHDARPCLSAYVTLGIADDALPPAARLRETLRAEDAAVWPEGTNLQERKALLAPVLGLLNSDTFWEDTEGGLAVFWGPGVFRYYLLPWAFSDAVHVGERFHMAPLIPLLAADGHYWILVLGSRRIRLLQASRRLAREVDFRDLPVALADLMSFDVQHRTWTFHTGARAAKVLPEFLLALGQPTPEHELSTRRRVRFLRDVDRAIGRLIGTRRRPLVVVGRKSLLSAYVEQSAYPELVTVAHRAPDDLASDALHRLTQPVASPLLDAKRAAAWKQVRETVATPTDAASLDEILAAARQGCVTDLFADLSSGPDRGADPDLTAQMESVSLQTYLYGGQVFVSAPGELPDGLRVAANVHAQPADRAEEHTASPRNTDSASQPSA